MKKAILAVTTAAALAGSMAIQPAQANPVWLVPALIVGGVVVGGATIAAASQANQGYYGAQGNVYVQPYGACHIEQRQRPDGSFRNVKICG
jgi:hypothetical protein